MNFNVVKVSSLLAGALGLSGYFLQPGQTHAQTTKQVSKICPDALNFEMLRLQDEKPINLCQFAGKQVLIVNTASYCGYTSQYGELETLQGKYKDHLTVIGVPSNDFGGQEPKSNREIANFCLNTFGVKFPMMAKSQVVPGKTQAPLYAHLSKRTGKAPTWNFNKYLISADGSTIDYFDSSISPLSKTIISKIKQPNQRLK